MCSSNCLLAIIAVIFPPLPVWIRRGLCSADSLINIALCVLGFLPGLVHAWYIIATTPEHEYEYVPVDVERGTHGQSQHYYAQFPGQHTGAHGGNATQPASRGYGTLSAGEGGSAAPPRYEEAVGQSQQGAPKDVKGSRA